MAVWVFWTVSAAGVAARDSGSGAALAASGGFAAFRLFSCCPARRVSAVYEALPEAGASRKSCTGGRSSVRSASGRWDAGCSTMVSPSNRDSDCRSSPRLRRPIRQMFLPKMRETELHRTPRVHAPQLKRPSCAQACPALYLFRRTERGFSGPFPNRSRQR